MQLNKTDLLNLYSTTVDEGLRLISTLQSRAEFLIGIISALGAGIIAGIYKATELHHYLLLVLGISLAFAIVEYSRKGLFRIYRLFIESITVRAKLSQSLGLTHCHEGDSENVYWKGESLLPNRYVEDYKKYESSEEYIEYWLSNMDGLWFMKIIYVSKVVFLVLFGFVSVLAIVKIG